MIAVSLGERSYEILVTGDCLDSLAERVEPWMVRVGVPETGRKGLVVTDTNVAPHAARVMKSLQQAGWNIQSITLDAGEATKCLEVISSLYDALVELQADRRTVLFAVGGGVIGDAAGFAAATYARGIPFLQVPTTLLADVDSSVGGKTGINHPRGKNLIGSFHQPIGVVIDTATLSTLPDREYRAGLAEVVKYGVILDESFFVYLEQHVDQLNSRDGETLRTAIARSCVLKANVVEQDEYETTGLRAVLNYGHTFGHAFEALAGYGELLHGEAVSIGMVYASTLAERLGRITSVETQRQIDLLERLQLPVSLPSGMQFETAAVIDRMRLDKKTLSGKLRFVLPSGLGHVELVNDVPEATVVQVLEELS